ncbi:MAG: SPOR domain-containing protein [Mariprofundaceae bacterium]
MDATAANKCAAWEKTLKKEQYIILEREEELSLKTKKNKAKFDDQEELERLIERHHASIESFNLKFDDFNRTCKKRRASTGKLKTVSKAVKPKEKVIRGIMPPEEVAASKALISTLKGYYIQAAAFKRRVITDANQERLNKNGYETVVITRPYIYALWVGPYSNRTDAKAAKEAILNDFRMDGYLIRFR